MLNADQSYIAAPPLSARTATLGDSIALQPGRGNIIDEVVALIAMASLPMELPALQPLRVPAALLVLGYFIFRWRDVVPRLAAAWWAFLLPGLAIVSGLWATHTMASVANGAQIGFGVFVAAIIASRLDFRQIIVLLLISLFLAALITIAAPNPEGYAAAWTGIFPHKNILGSRMLWLALASLAVLFSGGYRLIWRGLALLALPVALFVLSQTHAATMQVLTMLAAPMFIGLALLWRPLANIRGALPVLGFGGATLALLGMLLALNVARIDPVGDFFDAFGKEKTLTGRTEIWHHAGETIRENPVLGIGAGNYWRKDNPGAIRIADRYYGEAQHFSFHSLIVEIMVHLGAVGIIAAIYVFGRAVLTVALAWIRDPSPHTGFAAVAITVVLLPSLTESALFAEINFDVIIFWAAVISVLQPRVMPIKRG